MHILVTAGPTREALDPVRFISNRSSGRMGYALAEAFIAKGHTVTLISGPVALPPVPGAQMVHVESAQEMHDAVHGFFQESGIVVMVAAVADWRPVAPGAHKLKKQDGPPVIRLEPTPDILLSLRGRKKHQYMVGFAAETGDLIREAARKLEDKGLDLMVANPVAEAGSGFDVETNRVVLLRPGQPPEAWPLLSKRELGVRLADVILSAQEHRG